MNWAWLIIAVIFWQPIAMTAMVIYKKITGASMDYGVYLGNLKAWFLQLWDLIKYRNIYY